MNFYYNSAQCGAGKTYNALWEFVSKPQKTVFVVDRIDVFEQRINMIREIGDILNVFPKIVPIHSLNPEKKSPYGFVCAHQEIEKQSKALNYEKHVLLIITHASMMNTNWSKFSDWSIIIDEVPSIFEYKASKNPSTYDVLDKLYKLSPLEGSKWSQVKSRGSVSSENFPKDDLLKPLRDFNTRVTKKHFVCANVQKWSDLSERKDGKWTWLSVWLPENLSPFKRVEFLGASFCESTTAKIIQKNFPEFKFIEISSQDKRTWKYRNVQIRYFTQEGTSSTHTWRDGWGLSAINQVADWISTNTTNDHIFTHNHDLQKNSKVRRIPGEGLTPRQQGSNEWMDKHVCSILYSNKPDHTKEEVLKILGVTKQEAIRAAEYEDILQFCYRTSLRNPDDENDVEIRVYDKKQADFLEAYLGKMPHLNISSIYTVEAGVDQLTKPKVGRPASGLSAEEKRAQRNEAARKRMRKVRESEKASKSGTLTTCASISPEPAPQVTNTLQ